MFAGSGSAPNFKKIGVSRNELFAILKSVNFYKQSSSQCNEHLVSYIKDKLSIDKLSKISENRLKEVVKVFVSKLLTKWKQSHHIEARFMKKKYLLDSRSGKLPKFTIYCLYANDIDTGTTEKVIQSKMQEIAAEGNQAYCFGIVF